MRSICTTIFFCLLFAFQGMAADVVTYHNDNTRSAVNSQETVLTPANVAPATFGKIGFWPTDGKIFAMPLFLSAMTIGGTQHDVVYVVTENDTVYAFDAASGAILWRTSAIYPGEHISSYDNCGAVMPTIGITGTPVIDRSANAIYFVAATQDASNNYHERIYALSLTTGAQLVPPNDITATYVNAQHAHTVFNQAQHLQRPALLELNGYIYVAFGSHCDEVPYYGWLMEFKASTLAQTSVLNFAPTTSGPGGGASAVWMAGAGPAADSQGFIYIELANGTFDTRLNSQGFPYLGNFGNAAVKVRPGITKPMQVVDYFTMTNTVQESDQDLDLGSGGPLVVDAPGAPPLLIVSGKDTNLYVLNRNNMGKWNGVTNNIYQELDAALNYGMFSAPGYFNNTIYFGPEYGHVTAWPIVGGKLTPSPSSQSTHQFPLRGSSVTISANGTSNGVVWAPECINCLDTSMADLSTEVFHAFDASNLTHELYNTTQSGSRDNIGHGNKFITPLVANGRVYLGMTDGVYVFGLLGSDGPKPH